MSTVNLQQIYSLMLMANQGLVLFQSLADSISKIASGRQVDPADLRMESRDETLARMKRDGRIPADFDPDAPQG